MIFSTVGQAIDAMNEGKILVDKNGIKYKKCKTGCFIYQKINKTYRDYWDILSSYELGSLSGPFTIYKNVDVKWKQVHWLEALNWAKEHDNVYSNVAYLANYCNGTEELIKLWWENGRIIDHISANKGCMWFIPSIEE